MKNRSLMIFLLFVGYVVVYIDKTVMGFALLPIEREFNLQAEQLGYITGMFFLAYSLFQIPAGWLNDRFGFKKVLCSSLLLLGGFALCFGILGFGLGLLVTFRFLSGIGHSGYPCSCAKAVVANFPLEQRTFAQSILLSSAGLAMTVGPLVAVYCLDHIGWRGSFSVLGLLAFVIAACILWLVPNPVQAQAVHSESAGARYKDLLKSPIVLLLFVAIFCINIPSYGLMAWLPKFLVQQRGMPMGVSSMVVAAGGLGIWISSLGTGWLVGRYLQGREPWVIFFSSLLSALCIWLVFTCESALAASLFLFFGYIFLMASFVTVFTLPMKRLPSEVMGAAMGLINTGGTLGGFVAPIAMGYLITLSGGYMTTFVFLALAMVVSGLVILPLAGKARQPALS
ncbi:sugar phosphate permease [Serratia fonticola]|uniref:Sugar phosphate permease n=1 Tax=Serratia fonticola TaxID=47917 RepID=A0A559T5G0_SERFO|nr:MFS transporter [Serratia fonticola]TQI77680.1 sugar phosphate permease [Serratia fonticola]TQI95326.1 sugar phosphate permease [Serratia fonticola]TVZ69820.1 sugar phosphate permease [Serratia fonticola]